MGFGVWGLGYIGFQDLSLQQLDFSCALRAKLHQTLVVPQLALQRHELAWGMGFEWGGGGG